MGLASRRKWDARAVEYFRVAKLDGEAEALKYRELFHHSTEFDKAVNRLMARVAHYKENNVRLDEPHSAGGQVNHGTIPTGGTPAPVEDAGVNRGQ